jgi:hypothetical protein
METCYILQEHVGIPTARWILVWLRERTERVHAWVRCRVIGGSALIVGTVSQLAVFARCLCQSFKTRQNQPTIRILSIE